MTHPLMLTQFIILITNKENNVFKDGIGVKGWKMFTFGVLFLLAKIKRRVWGFSGKIPNLFRFSDRIPKETPRKEDN